MAISDTSVCAYLTMMYVYSLWYVYVIHPSLPQGDIGLPGSSGMIGPTVSFFSSSN